MDAGERTVFNGKAVSPGETQCSKLERLAEKEWSDDRDRLLSFYEENQRRLDAIPFGEVAAHMSRIVADCFLGSTWKLLASSLGIPDTQLETAQAIARSASQAPSLLQGSKLEWLAEKEWSDDRDRLLSYYEENQRRLDAIPFGEVAAHMSPIVADCFQGSTWKLLASSLGIPDTQLGGIEERARRISLRPLQVALQELYPRLDACCQSNSVGHLVAVLRESERLDVLYKLLPPIRDKLKAKNPERDGLFANGGSWTPQKGLRADSYPSLDSGVGLSLGEETVPAWGAALPIAPVGERRELHLLPSLGEDQVHRPPSDKLKAKHPERDGLFANGGSWPPQKGLRADSYPSLDSGVGLSLGEETVPAWGAALPIAPVGERRELRLLPSLGEDQVHRPPSDGSLAGLPEDDADKDEDEPCVSLLDTLLPKGSADGDDDCLTVLVNHLEEDCGMARELARRLEEDHGCQVLTQEQLQPARHMDPLLIEELVAKKWQTTRAVTFQVDAIVPLVSSAYLRHHRQIRRTGRVQSDDSSATHELYCLLQHRLVSSSCLCHMIFPARAPGVSYGQVRGHFIFSKSLPLWGDVPRLALLMRDCRRLRNIRQEPI
ncbi:hypothetical protein IscW_ISCW017523 [Ixodes scapularis]|uniref:Death domain-containing protein n=1 Tax=Ixodes scapularis TaxID=6945 RepID=B7PB20_IXOSC|nr:hypothetical protein IscW_ISCW017523 [Ixodes scapularis]|eukprot:XP_002407631.1 hypothetical protein IscW_ISCW017523 [Ixodes scapularis]